VHRLGGVDSHDLVEASEADVQRRVRHQLDDLGLAEVPTQLRPVRVIHVVVVDGQLLGEVQGGALARADQGQCSSLIAATLSSVRLDTSSFFWERIGAWRGFHERSPASLLAASAVSLASRATSSLAD
jgi:hypothetical protein